MEFDKFMAERRPVPLLTRENCDQWFTAMKTWLICEDLWFVAEKEESHAPTSNTPESGNSPPFHILAFSNQKTEAKARYWLIGAIDEEYIADKATSKEAWDALRFKYRDRLRKIGMQSLVEFIGYKMRVDGSIDEAWAHLRKLGRKIAATLPDMSAFSKPDRRFQALLQALPEEYTAICDVISVQDTLDVEKGLQKLQEKEAQLKVLKTALRTGPRRKGKESFSHQERQDSGDYCKRSSSSEDDHSPRRKPHRCYLCGGSHRMQNCEYLPAARRHIELERWTKLAAVNSLKHRESSEKPSRRHGKKKHRDYDVEAEPNEEIDSSSEPNSRKKSVRKSVPYPETVPVRSLEHKFYSHMIDRL